MNLEKLEVVLRLLFQGGAPLSEADRSWIRLRLEHRDLIEGDEIRVREMVSPLLWDVLTKGAGE